MLGLQASNLEQQERLYKNQIRLGLREILQQELDFYCSALNNISSVASIFAGFSFSGMLMDPFDNRNEFHPRCLNPKESKRLASAFNYACAMTTCLCLLTLVYSNYLGLFANRLALRGGEMSVELSVMRVRGEYKIVLYSLTVSTISWLLTLGLLGAYKLERRDRGIVIGVAVPTAFTVVYLYRRARLMFFLNKKDRFAGSTMPDRGFAQKTADVITGSRRLEKNGGDLSSKGGRLGDLVRDVDVRNNSLVSPPSFRASESGASSAPLYSSSSGGAGSASSELGGFGESYASCAGTMGSSGGGGGGGGSSPAYPGGDVNDNDLIYGPQVAPFETTTTGPPPPKKKKRFFGSVNFFK